MYRRWYSQAREGLHNTMSEWPDAPGTGVADRRSQATEAILLPDGEQGADHQGMLGGFGAFAAFTP